MADVIYIVDDHCNLHKLRNPDAFGDKELLQQARSIVNRYAGYKATIGEFTRSISNLKKQADAIGLELEP
jgi:hypothetical protein